LENKLSELLQFLNAPWWLHDSFVYGIFRTVGWVVAVMLPPMAIFFPLFTLLEDSGYLPRIAFNLDFPFKKCNACGKQALSMCMGFGCNAVGVTGCRIIDSKRERLLAILTNNLVPCNGRFPTIIALITMFLCVGASSNILSALILTVVILFSIFITFSVTKLLSKTVLKGMPSSYTLELPPYRKPQILKVIFRSVFDRTLFVLGRSIAVAAPAGLLIWIMANVSINDTTLLTHFADILDPFARILGLDGVILLAFILGLPANEIVIPIVIMAYMNNGSLTEFSSLTAMRELFVANGWDITTAISVILFSLLHWPCATTILTIKKETDSLKWTAVAVLLPTVLSILVCMVFNFIMNVFL
jgi:ferrous iron transport protein B